MGLAEQTAHLLLQPYLYRPKDPDLRLKVYHTETYHADLDTVLSAVGAATGSAPEQIDFDPKSFRDALAMRDREIKLGFLSAAAAGLSWAVPLAQRSQIIIRPEDVPPGDNVRGIRCGKC